jgi:hypothetical protein
MIYPQDADPADYRGLAEIFEYTNDDGELYRRNCGQAAAATLLTSLGVWLPAEERAAAYLGYLEQRFGPDNLGGLFGTSRRCIERICGAHGVALTEVRSEDGLRCQLDQRNPVVVMLGVSPRKLCGIELPSGHWMVAYGYDRDAVYLTNWHGATMPWPEFRRRWRSWVGLLIRMRCRGLAASSPS